ncbi:hypothetical protein SpCBS45565_g05492 [Spizellomyces sp. 'palustris']|nr:hypothetical protein SpCBS45565_g05492 [Spizellomyces sp. 'palustris']
MSSSPALSPLPLPSPPLSVVTSTLQAHMSSVQTIPPATQNQHEHRNLELSVAWEDSTGDEKRCWICFVEEREEDVSKKVRWVRPCKCKNSLKFAHEDCLLRWISEKQGPITTDVKCPACGHVYAIEESTDVVLAILTFVDKSIQSVVPYVTLAGVSMAFYVVSTTFGAYAVMTMCGPDEGERILSEANWGWRTWIGLPLIPIGLVCSRLTAADAALPLLPFLVLGNDQIRLSLPPSPALTVCLLPWARLLYNGVWATIWPWIERIGRHTPARNGAVRSGGAVGQAAVAGQQEEEEDVQEFSIGRRDGQRLVLGSLLLPAVSSLMGTLLGSIPWVRNKVPDPFHRNILGGCLFVVCKDVASAVYRAHKKRQRRTRRVREYRGD